MADKKIPKWLRPLGPLGTFIATAITILTTNWVVVVSALVGLIAALWSSAAWFFQLPAVHIGAGVFLVLLWTGIGVTMLIDRRKPRIIKTDQDYRYGLTFEGLNPGIDFLNEATWV